MRLVVGLLALGAFVAGCTESERASGSAERRDLPADIVCRSYGDVIYQGRSTGKVIYDEGGRVTFVDSASQRLTTIEGECVIVYARPRAAK